MTGKELVPFVLSTAIDKQGDGHVTTSALMKGRRKIGETSEVGLTIYEPLKHSFEDYLEIGRLLGNQNRRLQWVIGDWLNLVEDIFPDRYSQAIEVTGLSYGTLMNRASICRHIPEAGRKQGVGFSIHADVAYLKPKEREKWLSRVVKNDWTREILREHKRAEEGESSVVDPDVTGNATRAEVVPGDPVPGSRTCPHCGGALDAV